jgi:hypothetical protein
MGMSVNVDAFHAAPTALVCFSCSNRKDVTVVCRVGCGAVMAAVNASRNRSNDFHTLPTHTIAKSSICVAVLPDGRILGANVRAALPR